MLNLNYVEVPATPQEDINPQFTTWLNDKCVALDEGRYAMTLYIGHRAFTKTIYEGEDDTPVVKDAVEALPIRVTKPVTRDMAINAAEMAAYNLRNAMEVASFNASLARKARANVNDAEVVTHDEFIDWAKEELTQIGIV